MAFANKFSSLVKQVVKSNPSVYQAIRCMSSSKVFVGGLSYGTDEPSLREAFSGFGEVVETRVIMDRETGRSRGFGFVTFASEEEASAAMSAMDGKELHGRTVRVNYANDRTGGGGYSGGGGGGYGSGGYGGGSGGSGYGSGGYGGGGGYGSGGAGYGDNNNSYGGAGGNYGGDSYNAGGGSNYGGGSYNAGGGSGSNYSGDNYSTGTGSYGGNAGDGSMGYGNNLGGSSGGDFSAGSGNGFVNDKVDGSFH